jgi:hypothetical protein
VRVYIGPEEEGGAQAFVRIERGALVGEGGRRVQYYCAFITGD